MSEDSLNKNNDKQGSLLRCINIDCVFNSSNDPEHKRNICLHPNVNVEARFADITIAICSEFRSKKDYAFEKPVTLVELKTKEKTEISGVPDINKTPVEKVTIEELEETLNGSGKEPEPVKESTAFEHKPVKPVIVETGETDLTPSELYNLTDRPGTDFLILKKLYQPYMKRGMLFSVLLHILVIWILFSVASPMENKVDPQNQQRIVVVEDIETPKFDPPDVDKQKEDELKQLEEQNKIKENTSEVRPKITPRNIKPHINRPKEKTDSTMSLVNVDSLKHITDSLLAVKNKLDTNHLNLPDSLKNTYSENAIGMSLWYPKDWKLTDNRGVNLNQEQFNGVIINTDSLSQDPGAVQMFILIDDPVHSNFNKTTFKNSFRMDDSTKSAWSTDPVTTGAKRVAYKFFIFMDNENKKNVYVNTETKKELFDKYKQYIEAIVRSIKIVSPAIDKKTP